MFYIDKRTWNWECTVHIQQIVELVGPNIIKMIKKMRNVITLYYTIFFTTLSFSRHLHLVLHKTYLVFFICPDQLYGFIFWPLFLEPIPTYTLSNSHKFEICSYSASYYPYKELLACPLKSKSLQVCLIAGKRSPLVTLWYVSTREKYYQELLWVVILSNGHEP